MAAGQAEDTANNLWHIRPFQPADAPSLTEIFKASVAQLARGDYSPDQIAAWLSRALAPEQLVEKFTDGRTALVAESAAGRAVGFCDLEPDGHIDFLYVHPAAARRGVAQALVRGIEAAARDAGLERLYAEVSETALAFFRAQGFRQLHRQEFEIGGVAIHNHAMEKWLEG